MWTSSILPRSLGYSQDQNIKKKTRGIDKLLNEIIAENFPNLEKQVDVQMQTTFTPLNRHYQKIISPWDIINIKIYIN